MKHPTDPVRHEAIHSPPDPDRSEEIRQGNYAAFEGAFKTYYDDLCRFGLRLVGSREAAEEIVQDVFFDLWQHRERIHVRGALRPYLYGAVRNKALHHLRRRRLELRLFRQAVLEPATAAVSDLEVEHRELRQALRKALAAMPERRRTIFELSRHRRLSYAEIAAVLGISINTVQTQMGRALKYLRKRLEAFSEP